MNSINSASKLALPERRRFAKGATIFKEGDRADYAYILESGRVEIFKMISGRRVLLGTVRPQGIFGELGLVDESPRMASAYVSEDATCLVVSPRSIGQMLDEAPQGLRVLVQSMAETLRNAGRDLAEARFQLMELERS